MNEIKILPIERQKKTMRALKGLIIILFAVIGLLKVSIGTVVNFPIAFLFGDLFVAFFFILSLVGVYFMLFPLPKKRKRNAIISFSLLGLLFAGSVIYAYILYGVNLTGDQFSDNLALMIQTSKDNLSFNEITNPTWFIFAGVVGEGLLVVLSPLGPVFLLILVSLFILANLAFIFWPQLMILKANIKEFMRDLKKRRKVLKDAAIIHEEAPKDKVIQVNVSDLSEKSEVANENPLLVKVHEVENNGVKPQIANQPLINEPTSFDLPTLDIDEKIEAVEKESIPVLEEESEEDYSSLQKAVSDKGHIESISFESEEKEVLTSQNDTFTKVFNVESEVVSKSVNEVKPQVPASNQDTQSGTALSKFALYRHPSLSLLEDAPDTGKGEENRRIAIENEQKINHFFTDFDIGAKVETWTIGSSFTRFEISLSASESVKAITPIIDDLSRRLSGAGVRFEPIIPGKSTSGLEIANAYRTLVSFKECMVEIDKRTDKKYLIPLGKEVGGKVFSASFAEFPHLLVAGSTGSGKSVFLHTVLTSLIMKNSPDELRLLLIDPKRVELAQYANIPHLLAPIVKDPTEAKVALSKLNDEMEKRYRLFETTGVSKISEYNEIIEDTVGVKMPLIIAIIDEFSDLFENEKDVSTLALKLVQKSRAAGIHVLIATQRPDVKVITGNIKANITSRVAFMTASAIDSVTILGQGGAEALLGNGDMLVDSTVVSRGLLRLQAPFIPIKEVSRVTNYLRSNYEPNFYPEFMDLKEKVVVGNNGYPVSDELYWPAVEFCHENEYMSTNKLQQRFNLGWPRARSLYELLILNGIIENPDDLNNAKGAVVVKNKR